MGVGEEAAAGPAAVGVGARGDGSIPPCYGGTGPTVAGTPRPGPTGYGDACPRCVSAGDGVGVAGGGCGCWTTAVLGRATAGQAPPTAAHYPHLHLDPSTAGEAQSSAGWGGRVHCCSQGVVGRGLS